MSASSFTLSSLFALSSSFARRPGPTCQHSINISTCWNPAERKKMKLMKYRFFFESLIYGWSSVVECSGKFETFPMIWFQKVKTPPWSEGFHLLRGLCHVTEGRWVRFDPLSNVKHENDNTKRLKSPTCQDDDDYDDVVDDHDHDCYYDDVDDYHHEHDHAEFTSPRFHPA